MTQPDDPIERACLAAWPDDQTVTEDMRSRMRAAIAAWLTATCHAVSSGLPDPDDQAIVAASQPSLPRDVMTPSMTSG
jgi:hypothetical protein